MADLVCVDPKLVNQFWPHFWHLIKKAIDKVGITEFDRVQRDVLNGHALLWLVHENLDVRLAIVTSIFDDVLEIVAIGGRDLAQSIHLLKDLEAYGRAEGCKAMRIIGRKGWMRLLKDYEQKAIILQKAL